jgi:hypothetical protein
MSDKNLEICPSCGSATTIREKLVLIDEAWDDTLNRDPRLRYFSDLRADDLNGQDVRQQPLEQFVDGYYCDKCARAFVSEDILKENHRYFK